MPVSLKIFLTALAIIDDLGAVLTIAPFYTVDLSLPMLGGAAVMLAVLYGLNKAGMARLWPYLLLGVVLWVFVLASGVHATIAGVLLALTIPLRLSAGKPDDPTSPLHILEHEVHPWSACLILPVFGFANAGVSLAGIKPHMLLDPVTLGVALGLFVGKQVGVFGFVLAAVKLGLAQRPAHAGWWQVYGVSLLCGVGFTVSLFIGLLAFAKAPELEAETQVGVAQLGRLHGRRGAGAAVCPGSSVLPLSRDRPRPDDARPHHPTSQNQVTLHFMPRQFPRRRPGAIDGRLSNLILALHRGPTPRDGGADAIVMAVGWCRRRHGQARHHVGLLRSSAFRPYDR